MSESPCLIISPCHTTLLDLFLPVSRYFTLSLRSYLSFCLASHFFSLALSRFLFSDARRSRSFMHGSHANVRSMCISRGYSRQRMQPLPAWNLSDRIRSATAGECISGGKSAVISRVIPDVLLCPQSTRAFICHAASRCAHVLITGRERMGSYY